LAKAKADDPGTTILNEAVRPDARPSPKTTKNPAAEAAGFFQIKPGFD
jgi:hypothetical protein